MTFSNGGFEQDNESTSTVWAEHVNHLTITQRGYYVVDIDSNKAKVSAQSSPNLTVQVTSGDVFVGGTKYTVSSGSHSLSTEHSALTSGQSRYVFVTVNSSGALTNVAGTAAATASIKPPAYPNDKTVLAMIILTNGDSTIENTEIQDWRMEAPQGAYINGTLNATSTNLIVKTSTDTIATANAILTDTIDHDDTGSYGQQSGTHTLLTVPTSQIGVIKDDITITIDQTANGLNDGGAFKNGTLGFRLMIDNGSGLTSVDTTTYTTDTAGASAAVATLTWDISADGKYVSDDFGDDFSLRIDAYMVSTDSGTDGGTVNVTYDLSNGANYALWSQVQSSDVADATLLSLS